MKDLKISKELFEAVRNYKINKISIYGSSKYFYVFDDYLPEHNKIGREESFNDFFFECKEWALTKGYFIYSTNELSFIKSFSLETIETFSNGKDTEIECVLKACMWILENDIQED